MERVILGRLVGLEQTKVSMQFGTGEIKVFPRQELNISLQWVLENMSQMVLCSLDDGVITKIRPVAPKLPV